MTSISEEKGKLSSTMIKSKSCGMRDVLYVVAGSYDSGAYCQSIWEAVNFFSLLDKHWFTSWRGPTWISSLSLLSLVYLRGKTTLLVCLTKRQWMAFNHACLFIWYGFGGINLWSTQIIFLSQPVTKSQGREQNQGAQCAKCDPVLITWRFFLLKMAKETWHAKIFFFTRCV